MNLIANFMESKKRPLSYHVGRNLPLLGLQKWREEAGISRTSKLRSRSREKALCWGETEVWAGRTTRRVLLTLSLQEGFPWGWDSALQAASTSIWEGTMWMAATVQGIQHLNPWAAPRRSCHCWGEEACPGWCSQQWSIFQYLYCPTLAVPSRRQLAYVDM